MKFNYKIISLLFIIFFVSLSLVSATSDDNQTMQLNENDEIQNIEIYADELSAGTGTFTELQQIIWSSKDGDTITLDKDYSYNSDFSRTDLQIPRSSLTIDGQGHTLDGKSASRIFFATDSASNLIIKNINFANGKKDAAGAIFSTGSNTQIIGCTFTNNVATTGNVGGAILLKNGGSITDSTFKSNSAPSSGGAIRLEGDNYKVTGCTFENNNAGSSLGGAICAFGNNIIISGNTFTGNTAGRDGGAIDIEGDVQGDTGYPGYNNKIINNKFNGNTAIKGGAISANGGDLTISDNEFSKNHATELGGAIRIVGVDGTTGTISKNTFNGDYSDLSGGAIFSNGNSLTITDNKFTSTKNTHPNGGGGAITVHGSKNIITNNDFKSTDNKGSGGAVYFEGDNGQINGNNFTNAHSGSSAGALYVTGASATVNNNKFDSNTADSLAGALQLKSDNAKLNNNVFTGNIAKASGGAAYIEGTGITASTNTFTNNKGGSNSVGGAIRWNGDKATVTGNTFEGNSATNTGYAVYGEGSNSEITKNTFIGSEEGDKSLDWRGSNNKISDNIYGNSRETTIAMQDLTIYYGGSGKLVITLTDKTSKALAKKDISLTINNGVSTVLSTDGNGKAEYEVKDLTLGTYKATAKFAGDSDYDASTATTTITAKSSIESKDLTAEYGSAKFNATFFDSTGKALAKGESVSFTVDNDAQRVQVGNNGVATITVNKAPGDYTVNIFNTKTGESVTNKLKITKASANLKVTAKDIAEGENAVFDITSSVQNAQVTLTINGANYPATLEKGKAKITVSNLTAGKYPYTVKFAGNENYTAQSVTGTLNVRSDTLVITAPDLSKFFGGSERFVVNVADKTGASVSGITITILINGVQNNRTVENGQASVGINLVPGNYTVLTTFKGNADYNAVNATSTVTVKTTNHGKDVSKIEKGPEPYVATFTDGTGKKLTSGTAIFNINGIFYYREIESSTGEAKLNLKLGVGEYTLTAYNPVTGEQSSNIVKINPRFANNSDVTKYYRNDTQYHITLLGDDGKAVGAGETVTFNINGVFYDRQTNENGTATLNINLMPGDYVITAIYKECMISNKIKVLSIIKAQDIVMTYRDGTQFKATLLDGQGKPYPGQNMTFNINGVFYPRVTDNDGIAALNINLMRGEYIITSYYETFATSNKITIK